VSVKEMKEYIVTKHRGAQNISIVKINTIKELDDSVLLSRGSNVIVKRVQNKRKHTAPKLSEQKRMSEQKRIRGMPRRFLNQLEKPISKDEAHLKEQYRDVKLTVRGDAQLKIS
tara:strand:- start:810 stop:1151 length:342 start_codon:yes stop_codon:yes gene_type:complete